MRPLGANQWPKLKLRSFEKFRGTANAKHNIVSEIRCPMRCESGRFADFTPGDNSRHGNLEAVTERSLILLTHRGVVTGTAMDAYAGA